MQLRIGWDGREVRSVAVDSTRPLLAVSMLAGRPAAQAAAMVPRLYSVCARAQGAAAARAVEAALGREPDPSVVLARELEVARETALEYLWRLAIDLPRTLDETPQTAPVADLRRRLARAPAASAPEDAWREFADALEDTLRGEVLGMASGRWLGIACGEDLVRWRETAQTGFARLLTRVWTAGGGANGDPPLLPEVSRAAVLAVLLPALDRDPGFPRAPCWDGTPRETGALARYQGHGLVAAARDAGACPVALRLLARAVELASLVRDARCGTVQRVNGAADAPGAGVAWVENARGLLLHRVRLDRERVCDYAIVAPTEWNFHPRGPFVRGLTGVREDSEGGLRRRARLLAHSLDPCVAFQVRVGHA